MSLWEGTWNARPVLGTRGLFRADDLDRLTARGEQQLSEVVSTIIDLRNDDERATDRPCIRVPLDVQEATDFWEVWGSGPQFGTPLYYRPHLERFGERTVAVLQAMVSAPPGGVVFHCMSGRDRTGMIGLVVQTLLELPHPLMIEDYLRSVPNLRRRDQGGRDKGAEIDAWLEERGTSLPKILAEFLPDLPRLLERAGVDPDLRQSVVNRFRS